MVLLIQGCKETFHVSSAWKAVEIALNCVPLNSAERPAMSQVFGELKGCLEAKKVGYGSENKSKDSIEAIPLNPLTHGIDTQPLARQQSSSILRSTIRITSF